MLSRVPSPGARRHGLSCPRLAAGRIHAPRSALRRSPWPRCAGRRGRGGGVLLPPLVAGSGARRVSRSGRVGVCCVCSVSRGRFRSGGFRGAAFGPLSGRALGRFRLGSVVPPFAALAVRVRRGRAVFLVRRRFALRAVLGSALAAAPRLLRRACGCGWVCGLRAGLPVRAAVPVGVARFGGRACRLGRRSRRSRPWSRGCRVAARAGCPALVRAVWRCAAHRRRWPCWCVAALARSGCRPSAPGVPVGWCCCPPLALAGLRRCRCGWLARSCWRLRRRCRACRFPSRLAVVLLVLLLVQFPHFLFDKVSFFKVFVAIKNLKSQVFYC